MKGGPAVPTGAAEGTALDPAHHGLGRDAASLQAEAGQGAAVSFGQRRGHKQSMKSTVSPSTSQALATAHLRIAIQHLMTDMAKRDGVGYMDPAKMKRAVETVKQYFPATREVAVEDVYTNRFVPKLFPREKPF